VANKDMLSIALHLLREFEISVFHWRMGQGWQNMIRETSRSKERRKFLKNSLLRYLPVGTKWRLS